MHGSGMDSGAGVSSRREASRVTDDDEEEVEPEGHFNSDRKSGQVIDEGGSLGCLHYGVVCHGPEEHA
eukprot:6389894-Lingulodinium_polyedra.AAC.1